MSSWGVIAWLVLIFSILGSAFAASFLSDVAGACVMVVGTIGGFYLHVLITLNHMASCIRRGEFRMAEMSPRSGK